MGSLTTIWKILHSSNLEKLLFFFAWFMWRKLEGELYIKTGKANNGSKQH